MRLLRLAVIAALALGAASATACTNPLGPKPAGDNVASSNV